MSQLAHEHGSLEQILGFHGIEPDIRERIVGALAQIYPLRLSLFAIELDPHEPGAHGRNLFFWHWLIHSALIALDGVNDEHLGEEGG